MALELLYISRDGDWGFFEQLASLRPSGPIAVSVVSPSFVCRNRHTGDISLSSHSSTVNSTASGPQVAAVRKGISVSLFSRITGVLDSLHKIELEDKDRYGAGGEDAVELIVRRGGWGYVRNPLVPHRHDQVSS